jgi:flagellar FliJ protein
MKRADRLEPVQRIVDDTERRLAEHFAASERLVANCEAKLAELERYHADYVQGFAQRAIGGIGAASLRDYQAFMARLQEAIRQQTEIAERAKTDRDVQRERWQEAAQRAKALGNVIERWQAEERTVIERREQSESDERAQRSASRGLDG